MSGSIVAVFLAAGLAGLAAALVDGRSARARPTRHRGGGLVHGPADTGAGGPGSHGHEPAPPGQDNSIRSGSARRPSRVIAALGLGRTPTPPVAELLAALAAELVAGQPAGVALVQAASGLDPPPCPRAVRAAVTGADVPEALRADATAPGAADLAGLAACWEVAEHSGAGLAQAVIRLGEGVRATAEGRDQLRAEVSAAQASARMLAGLPLFGLVLGHWLGAHPLGWLLGTWPGRAALLVGLGLQGLGLLWLARMVAGVRAGL